MNTAQKVAKNTGVLFFAQLVSYPLGFLYVMYTARYLGTEQFGVLSFALAFTGIFMVLANMGFGVLAVREIARDKSLAKKYLGNVIPIKIILSIICFGLIVLSMKYLEYPEQTVRVVYFITAGMLFNSFTELFNSLFKAFEKMEYISIGTIGNKIIVLSLTLFAIFRGHGLVTISAIYSFSSLIVFIYTLFICLWKYVVPVIEIDRDFWKDSVKKALPFFLSAVVNIIAFKIDIIMLSTIKGDEAVGYYSAAYRLLETLIFIPAALSTSLYPVFSNFHISAKNALNSAYEKSFKFLLITGLPIAVGTTLLADRIILLIYGKEFYPAIPALQILIWTIPVIFLSYMLGTLFASINRQVLSLKIGIFITALNIIINLLLIPKYSFMGAALATVITYTASFILSFYFISRLTCKIPILNFTLGPLAANAIMGIFILTFIEGNIFLLVASSAAIYLIILSLFGVVSKRDYNTLFKKGEFL
ncbi:MAG: flippase [Methanosarcinaceae archaeon]|nr:flippase [Methanosarcinaceae archaeon]